MRPSLQARLTELISLVRRITVFLAKGPAYHYTYGRWRLEGWWRKRTDCFSNMDDATLFARLDLQKRELVEVREAVAREDSEDAKSKLAAYFRTRSQPKFHFSWEDREKILSVIGDEQKEATIRAANEVCENTFRFRRVSPVKFESGIDWAYRPGANTDWTWDLNRHPYFITLGKAYWYTGNEQYAKKFSALLFDWIAANPAGVGRQNWESVLEVAVRLNTWIWAYFLFRHADAFGQDEIIPFLKGLVTHADYLAARIERHAANNHLLLEAKALAFCGLLVPEFKEATAWRDSGLRILWDEVEKQVCADGVHAERAPLYHRRVLSDLLEMLVLLENNDLPVPEHVIHRVGNMLDFDRNITKPDGTIPLFSDSALTETQARFSGRGWGTTLFDRVNLDGTTLDENMAWLLGGRDLDKNKTPRESRSGLISRAFPEGGYFIMRGGTGKQELYLAFDCGPFGYDPVPVHGHSDALSFELYAYGRSLITDCGVYGYHMGDDWRNYFRGTSAHNTVVVDEQDQSTLLDTRRVYRPAQATVHQWFSNYDFDFVDGSHNGYERLSQPITHRRQIFFVKPEYWVVIDSLTGAGEHCFDFYFHLMPDLDIWLDSASGSLYATGENKVGLAIVPLASVGFQADIITGTTNPLQGWISLFSGERLAAPTLRYRQETSAPVQFCTVLYPYSAGGRIPLNVSTLEVDLAGQRQVDESRLTRLVIEIDDHTDYLIIDRGPVGTGKTLADYRTDAQLLYLRHRKRESEPTKILMRGGRQLVLRGQSLPNPTMVDHCEPTVNPKSRSNGNVYLR